jgi:hypothetical protein
VGLDVDWSYGAAHMWSGHEILVAEAIEALADFDARLFDPDPKSKYGTSVRVIGHSPTAVGGARRDPRAPRG